MADTQNRVQVLGVESIGTLILRYSLPAILSMVIFAVYNIIDSIFIGHGVGALALAGLAVAFPVMNLVFAFGVLVGIGGATLCSIRLGEKDLDGAFHVLGHVLLLSIIFALGFALAGLLLLDGILNTFGASPATLPYAHDFIEIILYGLPITYCMFNLNHVMRASGYPHKALLSSVVTVFVNLGLAPLFIFVFQWGIKGAALATVLAQAAGLIWVLSHFCQKKMVLHFRPGIFRLMKIVCRGILSIGLSPFLLNAVACLVVVVVNLGLKEYGGDMAIGAFGIINRILTFLVMAVIGLSMGLQPILGYNYGARQYDRLKKTLKYGLITGLAITSAGFIAAELFPSLISAMFTSDQELTKYATVGLRISGAAFFVVGGQIVISNFFQSIGQARISIFLSMTRQLIYLLPLLFILPFFMGLNGLWLSMAISDLLAFITAVVVLLRRLPRL